MSHYRLLMTNLRHGAAQVEEYAPTVNAQFRGGEPAELLRAAAAWLNAHEDASVVALNLTNFDLLGANPHGRGYLLDLVVDQGALRVNQ
jgi:hypothetical protein